MIDCVNISVFSSTSSEFGYLNMRHSFSPQKLRVVLCKLDYLLAVILSSSFLGGCSVHVLGGGVRKINSCCFFRGSRP